MTFDEAIAELRALQKRGMALSAFPTKVEAIMKVLDNASDVLRSGVDCAGAVVNTWSRGDLAGAVNRLDGWREGAVSLVAPPNRS